MVALFPGLWAIEQENGAALLVWARELQSIAQTGLTFATGTFDLERYKAIRSLAARMMATCSDANFVRVEGLFAEQAGYATPKVDVRGAVIEDGRILLAREIEDAGRWTMPGGWADVNQSPSESVIREMIASAQSVQKSALVR